MKNSHYRLRFNNFLIDWLYFLLIFTTSAYFLLVKYSKCCEKISMLRLGRNTTRTSNSRRTASSNVVLVTLAIRYFVSISSSRNK